MQQSRSRLRSTSLGTSNSTYFALGRLAPTGKMLTTTGINIFRLAGGKIAERWDVRDELGLGQQIGVIPTPGQAPA